MSQIDQAFIQAYAPEGSTASGYEAPSHFAKAQAAPHLKVHPQTQRAPHFPVYDGADPYGETAHMQQAALRVAPQPTTASPAHERRPLSSFAAPRGSMTPAFRPVLEVDEFQWPATVEMLLENHAELLVPVAEQLLVASEEGRSLVGIAGTRPAVGTTTVHLCLARLLASAQKAVAIVDGDFANRALARTLGLECEAGWENVLAGEAPLAECVVRSLGDGISLLPLVGHHARPAELLAGIQTSVSAGVLRYHYDVVLFDLGCACREPQASVARTLIEHCRLEASIIVADWTRDAAGAEDVERLMFLLGPTCLGLIGNQTLE